MQLKIAFGLLTLVGLIFTYLHTDQKVDFYLSAAFFVQENGHVDVHAAVWVIPQIPSEGKQKLPVWRAVHPSE